MSDSGNQPTIRLHDVSVHGDTDHARLLDAIRDGVIKSQARGTDVVNEVRRAIRSGDAFGSTVEADPHPNR